MKAKKYKSSAESGLSTEASSGTGKKSILDLKAKKWTFQEMSRVDSLFIAICVFLIFVAYHYLRAVIEGRPLQHDMTNFQASYFVNMRGQKLSHEQAQFKFDYYPWTNYTDFWICFAVAFASLVIERMFHYVFFEFFLRIQKEKNIESLRNQRAKKNVTNLFKGTMYTFSVCAGWVILSQVDYSPKFVKWIPYGRDDGSLDNLFLNYPVKDYPESVKYYYLVTLGYHVSKGIQDFFINDRRNDFAEMMLHHFLTYLLYFGSYMLNILPAGSLVIFYLDSTDVPVSFAKAFGETTYKNTAGFFGICMWVSWILNRLVFFPTVYYHAFYVLPSTIPGLSDPNRHNEKFAINWLLGLCSFLQILNVWWAMLITKMLLRFALKGKTNDIQNKID